MDEFTGNRNILAALLLMLMAAGSMACDAVYSAPLQVEIEEGPDDIVDDRKTEFKLSCNRDVCTYSCQLNDGETTRCSSTPTIRAHRDGKQIFKVQPMDDDGNVGEPVYYEWTVTED